MGRQWHRGHRAERRADRRHRVWTGVAIVAGVVAVGGAAFATITAMGDDAAEVATPTTTRAPASTTPAVASSTATTVPGRPCRAGLTPDSPLRLWIAGDSIAHSVGTGLGKRAAGTGVVAPVYESRVSSGLASPGFFDWPRRVGEELPRLDPEIVVFVMGTNDWAVPQATPLDASGQPAWKATYADEVRSMVDTLAADGRTLYWVGPPVLRDGKQEAGVREVASVIREVVAGHPAAVYVDAHDLLDTEDGSYTAVVETDGKRVQVRAGDGVHFTPDGADYLGNAVFALLDEQCRLKAQAVADSRQAVVETKGSTSVAPGSTATAPPPATSPATAPPATTPDTQPPATTPPTTATPDTTPPTVTTPPTSVG